MLPQNAAIQLEYVTRIVTDSSFRLSHPLSTNNFNSFQVKSGKPHLIGRALKVLATSNNRNNVMNILQNNKKPCWLCRWCSTAECASWEPHNTSIDRALNTPAIPPFLSTDWNNHCLCLNQYLIIVTRKWQVNWGYSDVIEQWIN